MRRRGWALVPLAQQPDLQIGREPVELLHHLWIDRHAVGGTNGSANLALLAGQTDGIEARQNHRSFQFAKMMVDLRFERIDRHESRYIHGDDEMPGVAGA